MLDSLGLSISDCRFWIECWRTIQSQIKNQKSKFTLKTPKRGQSAQSPDRLFRKKRLFLQSNFLGVTPAPQYSLKLTSNNVTVKRAWNGTRYLRVSAFLLPAPGRPIPVNYLTSTVAPASVRFCLIVSASSFEMASFTAFGAASTTSLAPFKPRAVTSRTTLITF